MQYHKLIPLKNGQTCVLRNGTAQDAQAVLDIFILTHTQTDNLLSYPDEITFTAEEQAEYLQSKTDSANEIELLAEIDGKLAGTAGIEQRSPKVKLRHRCEFGIGIDQAYWGLGIGRALTEACIECARISGGRLYEKGADLNGRPFTSALALGACRCFLRSIRSTPQ